MLHRTRQAQVAAAVGVAAARGEELVVRAVMAPVAWRVALQEWTVLMRPRRAKAAVAAVAVQEATMGPRQQAA
ncbi:hypothetical protein [Rhodoligotrophos defluvii]|uniref:hypothetical protein n=1 Tax=Rhodoligotrophos defluvii TaxID=2561934 RepID=UPI0010C9F28D|nr:hypothetical protein [Rhodoligotrophos defluvii]